MIRGSIRDLSQFVGTDAFVKFSTPLPPEQLVLASYTFLPYVRSGIAATLTTPFSFAAPARATVNVTVPVVADVGTVVAGPVPVTVRGPGDVTGIDAAQVIRTWPLDGHANAETEDLVQVEFDRPDFPWMFTPTAPDAQGRLVPWVTLIVAARGAYALEHPPGRIPRIHVNRDQLQPLDDAWAWAHGQVMGGTSQADPNARTSLEPRLADVNPAMNLSRLVCPRHLDPETEYIACIVPTFQAGVEAAIASTVTTTTLAPAWTAGGAPDTPLVLPVYYSFTFATGAAGDFESLARRLRSIPAPPNIGRRRLDTSNPGNGLDPIPDGQTGREQVVEGPVVSLADPSEQDGWPSAADQEWPATTTDTLRDQLNAADVNLLAPDADAPAEPTVTPPLYAGTAIARTRVEAMAPQWFRDLNLEPKHRVVAGLGTRVVQMDQEALMASAWNQVSGVEAANRALRWAQFARYVGASLHRRHLSVLGPGAQLAVTERVHARVLDTPNVTVYARVEGSSLPRTVASAAFRRLTRARGPVARFAAAAIVDRGPLVDRLVAADAGLTRDWVRTYVNPDGVTSISPASRTMVSSAIATQVLGAGVSKDAALAAFDADLSERPSFPDALTPAAVQTMTFPAEGFLASSSGSSVLDLLLASMPTNDQMEASRTAALVGAGHALLLRQFVDATGARTEGWTVDQAQAIRLGLAHRIVEDDRTGGTTTTDGKTRPGDGTTTATGSNSRRFPIVRPMRPLVTIGGSALTTLATTAVTAVRRYQIAPAELTLEQSAAAQLAALLRVAPAVQGAVIQKAFFELSDRLVRAEGPSDVARNQLDVPALALVAKLDPAVTVTARVKGRLGALPAWLRPDWFNNLRIDPVMVGPAFPFPMCQALYRYDQKWMIPGVAEIARTDMVTLLKTNNVFVEAFLVGLNHEMGRELLWRGYPTDARGTYFKSFWTGNDELTQAIHQFADLPLGGHMKPTLDDRIVMLVRGELVHRYPGVIGHAVRQAGKDAATGLPLFEAGSGATVLFRVHLAPNILLVAFDLLPNTIKQEDPNQPWWFLLAENPTEPRFGLDDVAAGDGDPRNNLTWAQLLGGLPQGQQRFLRATTPNLVVDGVTWGSDAAAVAHLLFQLPARAAFLGTRMLTNVGV